MAVQEFFHRPTGTMTYVVSQGRDAVVIDSCLDFDLSEGKITRTSLDAVIAFIRERGLKIHWILETHVHADHLTGAAVLQKEFPETKTAICEKVREVQRAFNEIFASNVEPGWPFDRLLNDGEVIEAGSLRFKAIATPGHTQACMSFLCDDGLFTGDSIFMPEAGTGRCDFPGGNARQLYQSIQKLYQLDDKTPVYVCHDYPAPEAPPKFRTTIGDEKSANIHVKAGSSVEEFVGFREARDKKLSLPKLFYPSLYINLRGGRLPDSDEKGRRFLLLPLSASL